MDSLNSSRGRHFDCMPLHSLGIPLSAEEFDQFVNAGGLGVISPISRAFSTAAVREWTPSRR
jgi:hypothetical protein